MHELVRYGKISHHTGEAKSRFSPLFVVCSVLVNPNHPATRGTRATVLRTPATPTWTDSDSRVPMDVNIKSISRVVLPHLFCIIGCTYMRHI